MRVEISNLPVTQIVEMFEKGEFVIPEIQRDLVWQGPQMRDLLDSMYRGYPCGSLLLWEPSAKARKDFKNLLTDEVYKAYRDRSEDGIPKYMLIDGQQRVATILAVKVARDRLRNLDPTIDRKLGVLAVHTAELASGGLETRAFSRTESDIQESNSSYVWINDLLDRTFESSNRFRSLTADAQDAVRKLRSRIDQANFPVQYIKDCEYEEAAEIFARINNTGVDLTNAEVFLAAIVPRWKGGKIGLSKCQKELRGQGFDVDLTLLMRLIAFFLLSGTKGRTVKKLKQLVVDGQIKAKDLDKGLKRARASLLNVVKFLKDNFDLQYDDYLPSISILIPMAFYFDLDPTPGTKAKKFLRRFFVAAQIADHYGRSTDSILSTDIKTLLSHEKSPSSGMAMLAASVVQEAKQVLTNQLSVRVEDFYKWRFQTWQKSILLMILQQNEAQDFRDHLNVDGGTKKKTPNSPRIRDLKAADMNFHHIFPRGMELPDTWTQNKKSEYYDSVDCIANLTFIGERQNKKRSNESPAAYLPSLGKAGHLQAHMIPADKEMWKHDNYQKFLKKRAELLKNAFDKFLKTHLK